MHPDYTLRATRDDDIPHLPAVEAAANTLFPQAGLTGEGHVMPAEEHRAYQRAGRSWVALNADGLPVGFIVASVVSGNAHIDEVDVHPDHGRRGIGRALVEHICEWARESGYPAISLTTERHIPWNAPFYARLGFAIVPPEEWTADQQRVFESEAAIGIASSDRVLMIRPLMEAS